MSHRLPPARVPVSLRRLFPACSFVGCADIRVAEATERSDRCNPGSLYAAIPGTRVDGTRYVRDALESGARAVLTRTPLVDVPVPQCVVPNVRKAYAELCHALAGHPAQKLGMAGVTGTNGKTTVTWLLRAILNAAGERTGLLGTIEYHDGRSSSPAGLTTPDSQTLAEWLGRMVRSRTTHAVMEVSSHALHQDRCAGIELDVAVVTNVTHDHFDYHADQTAYLASKARIAELCGSNGLLLLNADDPGSLSIKDRVEGRPEVLTYGRENTADVRGRIIEESAAGTRFRAAIGGEHFEIATPLVGRHNVSNCLAAAVVADRFNISPEAIVQGIESLRTVPGRLHPVRCGQHFDVFVDYAHTPDALRHAVRALQQVARGRVICVFGAGGDRDRSKRPLLAGAAAEADVAVVTSDNPRTENPQNIIQDVLTGFEGAPSGLEVHVEIDRAAAIEQAIRQAEPGDCVLVAGKGHEAEQIVGSERIPFDDCQVVRGILAGAHHAEANRTVARAGA